MYMEMRPEGGQRIHKAMCSGMERTSSKPVSLGDHSPSCARSSFGDSDCGRCRALPPLCLPCLTQHQVNMETWPRHKRAACV